MQNNFFSESHFKSLLCEWRCSKLKNYLILPAGINEYCREGRCRIVGSIGVSSAERRPRSLTPTQRKSQFKWSIWDIVYFRRKTLLLLFVFSRDRLLYLKATLYCSLPGSRCTNYHQLSALQSTIHTLGGIGIRRVELNRRNQKSETCALLCLTQFERD